MPVSGPGWWLTERDFEAEERGREIRDTERRRHRRDLEVDTPESTAIVYADGCVAIPPLPTERQAKEMLARLSVEAAERYEGASTVPAYARWDGPVCRIFRRADDVELHRPFAVGCRDHWVVQP